MWHYILPVIATIPGYGVWTYVSIHPEIRDNGISAISLYGMAFLGQMVLISQPIVLSYRTSTLYGAAEQAVGSAAAVASLTIASIIGPQVKLPQALYYVIPMQVANYFVSLDVPK